MKHAMIKSLRFALLLAVVSAAVAFTGCAKKIAVDTVKLEYAFQTADDSLQTNVTAAIEDIEKANYSGAVEKLKKVAADPKATADQKAEANAVIAQIEH